MTFKIKLKVGFFKTQFYNLAINDGKLILTPFDNKENDLVINDNQLKSVNFIQWESREGELEIITHDAVYLGSLAEKDDFAKLFPILSKELGSKFLIHKGALD